MYTLRLQVPSCSPARAHTLGKFHMSLDGGSKSILLGCCKSLTWFASSFLSIA